MKRSCNVELERSAGDAKGCAIRDTGAHTPQTPPITTDAQASLPDARGLFEARASNDLASKNTSNPSGGNTVDYYTRQRLLSKIAGNSTPRSNTFMVWVTVGFFEAYEAVPVGELLAYPGSAGTIEIAVREGDACTQLGVQRGALVRPAGDGASPYR